MTEVHTKIFVELVPTLLWCFVGSPTALCHVVAEWKE